MSDRRGRVRSGAIPQMTTEADIENAFVAYASSRGCEALKLRIDGQNGWPDRTVISPGGVLFMEFKRPEGKLRPMQKVWRKMLREMGHEVWTPRSVEEAKTILDRFLGR